MRICFLKEFAFNTYSIPAQFLANYNKTVFSIKDVPEKDDVIGVTIFNNLSTGSIRTIRRKYPHHKIIAGGIGAFSYYRYLLMNNIVDYVYFGEAFEFDKKHIITKEDIGKEVHINRIVPYEKLPIIQSGKKLFYMLCETGCPFRCEFCQVSHCNNFTSISDNNFVNRIKFLDRKVKNNQVTLITNEAIIKGRNWQRIVRCNNNRYVAQSTTLKYYLSHLEVFKDQPITRFGIELPTEEDRKKHLPPIKQITDDEIKEIMNMDYKSGHIIQLFFIWNYLNLPIDNYKKIGDYIRYDRDCVLRVAFTTHIIHPYTPQQTHVLKHIEQLQKDTEFENIKKYVQGVNKTRIFAPQKNINILPQYIRMYGTGFERYTLPKPKDNIIEWWEKVKKQNPTIESDIEKNINTMKIENDKIQTI